MDTRENDIREPTPQRPALFLLPRDGAGNTRPQAARSANQEKHCVE
jgi:hypothetical protein